MCLELEEAVSRAVTVLLLSDFQDDQHAGSLVRGWEELSSFPGACFQDPRLPLVRAERGSDPSGVSMLWLPTRSLALSLCPRCSTLLSPPTGWASTA